MKESDVRKAGEEQGRRPLTGASPAPGQDGVRLAPEREADEDWLAFAAEDPAFFIKSSDAV